MSKKCIKSSKNGPILPDLPFETPCKPKLSPCSGRIWPRYARTTALRALITVVHGWPCLRIGQPVARSTAGIAGYVPHTWMCTYAGIHLLVPSWHTSRTSCVGVHVCAGCLLRKPPLKRVCAARITFGYAHLCEIRTGALDLRSSTPVSAGDILRISAPIARMYGPTDHAYTCVC